MRKSRHFGLLLLAVVLLAGCDEELDRTYGRREGMEGRRSINGTSVLGDMFQKEGHQVISWSSLSPRLRRRADCIVWFPDDFRPPSKQARKWLEEWLEAAPQRTLVYVGRDFDATPWYWKKVEKAVPADQAAEIRGYAKDAEREFARERRGIPKVEDCEWFKLRGDAKPRQVRTLSGEKRWVEGVDPAKLEIELHSRMEVPTDADVLLRSGGDVLVAAEPWDDSRLIVVANGSFLLNAMLVNHEHRKLAGQLIGEVGDAPKTVVFLESGPDGPSFQEDDLTSGGTTGLELLGIWPLDWVLLHLMVIGIIFCFSRYPIFGRPREPEAESTSDFGKHLQAFGELMERSRDSAYALTRILRYRQLTGAQEKGGRKKEEGRDISNRTSPTTPVSGPTRPGSEL